METGPKSALDLFKQMGEVLGGDDVLNQTQPEQTETTETTELETKPAIEEKNEIIENNEITLETTVEETVVEKTNLSLLTSELITEGLLPEYDIEQFNQLEPEKQLEAFKEMHKEKLETEANSMVDGWIENMPEDLKFIIQNYKEGIPATKVLEMARTRDDFSSITEDDVEKNDLLAEKVITFLNSRKGISQEDTREQIEILRESGKLGPKAASKLTDIKSIIDNDSKVEKERIAQSEKQRIDQINDYNSRFKDLIKNTEEIIPGLKLTDSEKKQIFEASIPQKNGKSRIDEKWEKNPLLIQQRINYFETLGLFEEKPDFSKIAKALEVKAKGAAFNSIQKNEEKSKLFQGAGSGQHEKPKVKDVMELFSRRDNLTWK